jgi:hypothetical protein
MGEGLALEGESESGRLAEPPRPEEAKPGRDIPSDRDLNPRGDG